MEKNLSQQQFLEYARRGYPEFSAVEAEGAFQACWSRLEEEGLHESDSLLRLADDWFGQRRRHRDDCEEDFRVVNAILRGGESEFRPLYRKYRDAFVGLAKRRYPRFDEDQLSDAYQDALIEVIEKYVRAGKIRVAGDYLISSGKHHSLYSLIVRIGLNMLFRRSGKPVEVSEDEAPEDEVGDEDLYADPEKAKRLQRCLPQQPQPHQLIIFYFYYLRLPMESIAKELNYTGADVVAQLRKRVVARLKICMERG